MRTESLWPSSSPSWLVSPGLSAWLSGLAAITLLTGGCGLLFPGDDSVDSSINSSNLCHDQDTMFFRKATGQCSCTQPGFRLVDDRCCDPSCAEVECGENDCGEWCAYCPQPATCVQNQCCEPSCDERECGYDGCRGSCGDCDPGEQCVEGFCEIAACIENCDELEYSCSKTLECMVDCGSGTNCSDQCFLAASPSVQSLLWDYWECLQDNMCRSNRNICVSEHCSSELATCLYSKWGLSSCTEVLSCFYECGQDEGCADVCFANGSRKAQAQALAVKLCLADPSNVPGVCDIYFENCE